MLSRYMTIEEYEKQKKEYTHKALSELQEQMKLQPRKTENSLKDIEEEDENSSVDEDDVSSGNINVIINPIRDNKKEIQQPPTTIRRRRPFASNQPISASSDKNDFMQAVYAQREIEIQELNKQKNKIHVLKNLLRDEENKNHFLKLDLNNANIEINLLMEKITKLTKDNELMNKTHQNDMKIILIFKIFTIIFILLTIFSNF